MLYTQTPLLRSAPVKESPTKGTTALLLNCNEKSIYQVIHNVNTPMSHNEFAYYITHLDTKVVNLAYFLSHAILAPKLIFENRISKNFGNHFKT